MQKEPLTACQLWNHDNTCP